VTRATRIWTEIDYERDGKQIDWLHLHHSVTRSAYGDIMIPIAVVKNGKGPTVLLTAANHGDEYEGQIALSKLIRALDPAQIRGRVIMVPALNLPAALAGTRTSPLDGGNLNRSFPGDPDGGPTAQIAFYVDTVLMPLADYFHDLHSGGGSLAYMPFASTHFSDDPALDARAMAALEAFAAPISLVWRQDLDTRVSSSSAIRHKVAALGSEFGGGGSVSLPGLRIVETGLRRLLAHAGVTPPLDEPTPPTRKMEVKSRRHFVYAPEVGVFEPFCELGDEVLEGQPAGQVHFVDNPARPPVVAHFRAGGLLVCKRHPGRVERGDCVAHLATDLEG
jgi:uncharacterized protein